MPSRLLLILVILALISSRTKGQTNPMPLVVCPLQSPSKPTLTPKQAQFELLYQQISAQKGIANSNNKTTGNILTLPVVIHVMHNGAPNGTTTNPSIQEIENILLETNLRFRHQQPNAPSYSNPYYGADTEIELCLASTNPDGFYTNGVIRYQDANNYTGTYNDLAPGLDALAWDKSKYLNVFICDMTNAYGVYLGAIDIVLIKNTFLNAGLLNHEIGHYLALNHIFSTDCQNGNCLTSGDRVCDTPVKNNTGSTGGGCQSPGNSCFTDEEDSSLQNPYRADSLGGLGEQPDMLDNYMDYSSTCWNSFTLGQKARMRVNIQNSRASLLSSAGCDSQVALGLDAGVTKIFLPGGCQTTSKSPEISIQNFGQTMLTSMVLQVFLNGALISSELWIGQLEEGEVIPYILQPIVFPEGNSTLEVKISNPNSGQDENNLNDAAFETTHIDTGGFEVLLEINFDNYPSETSWEIQNHLGHVVASNSPYTNENFVAEYLCLNAGCYSLVVKDQAGDGICCGYGNGSYGLKDIAGNILVDGASFTFSDSTNFCFVDPNCITLDIQLWLEGPYQRATEEMTNLLYTFERLPTAQPYNTSPWNVNAAANFWSSSDYPSNTVDWVLVSLRSTIAASSTVYEMAGLLQKDGRVLFPEPCIPSQLLTDPAYYINVEHRSHMGIMTPLPISISDLKMTHDFRVVDSYRTTTSLGQKQVSPGVYALFGGDMDQSDTYSYDINAQDRDVWQQQNGVFDSYFPADINLDSDANGEDKTIWQNNSGIFSGVPK